MTTNQDLIERLKAWQEHNGHLMPPDKRKLLADTIAALLSPVSSDSRELISDLKFAAKKLRMQVSIGTVDSSDIAAVIEKAVAALSAMKPAPGAAVLVGTAADDAELPWDRLVAISDVPIVHEAIQNFSHDSTEDNAVCMIREILKGVRVVVDQDWICPQCKKPKWAGLIGVTLDDGARVCSARCERARLNEPPQPVQSVDAADEAKLEELLRAFHEAAWQNGNRGELAPSIFPRNESDALRSFFKASRSAQAAQGMVSVPIDDETREVLKRVSLFMNAHHFQDSDIAAIKRLMGEGE